MNEEIKRLMTIAEQIEFMRVVYRLMWQFKKFGNTVPEVKEVLSMIEIIRVQVTDDKIKQIADSLTELERLRAREKQREMQEKQGDLFG